MHILTHYVLWWRDGVVDDHENEILEIMRKKFGITQEEQVAAEKKVLYISYNQAIKKQ